MTCIPKNLFKFLLILSTKESMLKLDKLFKSASLVFIASGIELALSVLITISLARILAPQNLGILLAAESFMELFKFFYFFGFANTIMRQASMDTNGFEFGLSKALGNALIIKAFTLVPLGLFIYYISLLSFHETQIKELICVFIFVYLIESFASLFGIIRRAQGQFKLMSGILIFNKLTRLLIIYLVLNFSNNLIYLAYAFLIEKIIQLLVSFLSTIHLVKIRFAIKEIPKMLKDCLGFAFVDPLQGMQGRFDNLIINNLLSAGSLAYYAIPAKLNNAFGHITNSLCSVFIPNLHQSFHADKAYYKKNIHYIFKAFNLFALIGFLVVFYCAKPALILLFGSKYNNSFPLLPFFAYICFLTILERAPELVMISHASHKARAIYKLGTVILNIILTYFFVQKFGLLGSVYSTLIANSLQLIIQFLMTKEFIKIQDYLLLSCIPLIIVHFLPGIIVLLLSCLLLAFIINKDARTQ